MVRLAVTLFACVSCFSTASALPIISTGDPLDYVALNGGSQVTFDEVDIRGDYGDLTLGEVRFTADQAFTITNMNNGGYNTWGGGHLTNSDDGQPGVFRFDFLQGTNAFAFNFGATGVTWLLSGFDSRGKLLEELAINPTHDSNRRDYYGLTSSVEFHFATLAILSDASRDEVLIDNVTIAAKSTGPSPVPLPGALPLLAAGLFGLGAFKRLRR
jgi:hypothetical protein